MALQEGEWMAQDLKYKIKKKLKFCQHKMCVMTAVLYGAALEREKSFCQYVKEREASVKEKESNLMTLLGK